MPSSYSIHLNESAHRFELPVEGNLAIAEFVRFPGGVDFTHTLVPHELEGRGIGSALVRYILDYAAQQQLQVRASCSFVGAYIERHPDYQHLLAPTGDGRTE